MGDTTTEQPVVVEDLPKISDEVVEEKRDEIVSNQVEKVVEQEVVVEDKVEDNESEFESVGSGASLDGDVQEIENSENGVHSENEEHLDNERHSETEEHSEIELEDGGIISDDGSVSVEREEGDGQESAPSKKVDDDEDKKNPQYIPKRGTFYEHDDRTLDDENEVEESIEKTEKQNKKNVWMEKKEKWGHDRFDDKQQAPKSRAELVSIYGYDIRNEDGPPRARRRRRYGRGPNKYTRTWEDEDAYKPTKLPTKPSPRKPRRESQEYPELGSTGNRRNNNSESETSPRISRAQEYRPNQPEKPAYNNENNIKRNITNVQVSNKPPPPTEQSNRQPPQRPGTGRVNTKPRADLKNEIKDSDYMGMTRTRQYRNSKFEQKVLPRGYSKDAKESPPAQNNSVQSLEEDLSKFSIQDNNPPKNVNKQNNNRQASIPPRMQSEQKGSKRYSSLRQRSLPETAAPPFNPQASNYYNNDYNQGSQPPQQQQQQGLLPQPPQIHTTQVSQIAPPQLPPSIPQQAPVGAAAILQAPPQYGTPFSAAPPTYLQPTVAPTPYIPPPPIINYVQGQPPFPQPAPFPNYQQYNAGTPQPAELYQCQGGTTYYSTQSQQLGQRMVPIRRPKAAIPIVPPPQHDGRGRVRNEGEEEMYERIDTVNNFEEPVYVLQ